MRLKILVLALAASAVAAPAQAQFRSDPGLSRCVIKNAVELGMGNNEDAGTVARAAITKCGPEIDRAYKLANVFVVTGTLTEKFAWATSEERLVEQWKAAAIDEGIAAVIEARANKALNAPTTSPTPTN